MPTEPTHGEQRLGLLTSSRAHTIMRGRESAWATLRDTLWAETAEDFDGETTGARAFGHENEEPGAAKFFERHPEVTSILPGGFYRYDGDGPLHGMLGSSPDFRLVMPYKGRQACLGLEVKSPTTEEKMDAHKLRAHYDQCQHGLLVTRWPAWYLFVHFDDKVMEHLLLPDKQWQTTYLQRAEVFLRFLYEDRPVKRRKLSIFDIRKKP